MADNTERSNRARRAAAPKGEAAAPPVVSNEIASILDDMEEENRHIKLVDSEASPTNGNGHLSQALAAFVEDQTTLVQNAREIMNTIDTGALIGHDFTQHGPKTFTCINGVVLRIKTFPQETSLRVQQNMLPERPEPKRTFNEVDQKYVVDDQDPEYKKAMIEYNSKASNVAFYVRTGFGTELISKPDDVWGPDDPRWVEMVSSPVLFGKYGVTIDSEPGTVARYVHWLEYYVLTDGDVRELYKMLERASGMLSEKDVREAQRSFRRNN